MMFCCEYDILGALNMPLGKGRTALISIGRESQNIVKHQKSFFPGIYEQLVIKLGIKH